MMVLRARGLMLGGYCWMVGDGSKRSLLVPSFWLARWMRLDGSLSGYV